MCNIAPEYIVFLILQLFVQNGLSEETAHRGRSFLCLLQFNSGLFYIPSEASLTVPSITWVFLVIFNSFRLPLLATLYLTHANFSAFEGWISQKQHVLFLFAFLPTLVSLWLTQVALSTFEYPNYSANKRMLPAPLKASLVCPFSVITNNQCSRSPSWPDWLQTT